MDKKAIKILFNTYWSSTGWKPEKDQVTPPGDLEYARRAGVMFDPIRLSHDDVVRRAIDVRSRIEPRAVAAAFLASLSTRRLDLRSAAGSFSVLRHFPEHEHGNRRSRCPTCGGHDRPDEDVDVNMNVLNFERLKWGGVRHEDPIYATFDLERFPDLDTPPPTDADLAILHDLVRAIGAVPPNTTAPQLQGKLGGILPSNKAELGPISDLAALSIAATAAPSSGSQRGASVRLSLHPCSREDDHCDGSAFVWFSTRRFRPSLSPSLFARR